MLTAGAILLLSTTWPLIRTVNAGVVARSPLLARMHPLVRRDLPPLRQLDHVHRRRIAALAAVAAFQRRFQFPQRRVARAADGVERQACAGLAAVALHFQPAQSAVEALADRG